MSETPLLVAEPSVPPAQEPPPDPPPTTVYVVLLQDVQPSHKRGQIISVTSDQATAMITAESARMATAADIAIAYPNIN